MAPPPPPPSTTPKPTSSLARRRRNSAVSPGVTGGGGGVVVTPSPSAASNAYPWEGFAWGSSAAMENGCTPFLGMEIDDYCPPNANSPERMPSPKVSEGAFGSTPGIKPEEDTLSKISQAMTLLSLHPPDLSASSQTPLILSPGASPEPTWPEANALLKESLRQSLSALKGLDRIGVLAQKWEADNKCQGYMMGAEDMEELDDVRDVEKEQGGEEGVVGIMNIYDRALAEMTAAREAMALAEHRLAEEKEAMRERLLKG
ncbi:hypothetical protein RUND412_004948 [Rhizina undulata]